MNFFTLKHLPGGFISIFWVPWCYILFWWRSPPSLHLQCQVAESSIILDEVVGGWWWMTMIICLVMFLMFIRCYFNIFQYWTGWFGLDFFLSWSSLMGVGWAAVLICSRLPGEHDIWLPRQQVWNKFPMDWRTIEQHPIPHMIGECYNNTTFELMILLSFSVRKFNVCLFEQPGFHRMTLREIVASRFNFERYLPWTAEEVFSSCHAWGNSVSGVGCEGGFLWGRWTKAEPGSSSKVSILSLMGPGFVDDFFPRFFFLAPTPLERLSVCWLVLDKQIFIACLGISCDAWPSEASNANGTLEDGKWFVIP